MGTQIRIGLCLVILLCITQLNEIKAHVHKDAPASISQALFNPSQQYQLLQKELNRYSDIIEKGGWPTIRAPKKYYMKGQKDPAIKNIKARLRATGEFNSEDTSSVYTDELVAAVQKIQKRYGYEQTGVVDKHLAKLLNVPVDVRINQLLVNMDRFLNSKPVSEGTRLVANIPEFRLHVYEGTQHIFDMAIVVGSVSNKTVIFDDELTHVVFSPYWNVPQSIVRNEILPKMRSSSTYLRRNGYEKTGTENGLPVIRQKPGPGNSLGLVKFVFPNNHNIYFHDTPQKSLFEFPKRTFSHGCIRLEEPAKLAEYLLRNDPDWNATKIRSAMNAGQEQWVKLDVPVAVSLTYYTAWVDNEGVLNFRQDVYGLDKERKAYVMK